MNYSAIFKLVTHMSTNQNTITATLDDMYSHMDGYVSQEMIPDSHTTTRSVLDSFGVETVFNHIDEEMPLYPGAVFDGQHHFWSLGTVR
jgi:hypothetical protein